MLKFVITYCDDTQNAIENPLTVVMNSELGVPADDLTITFPFSRELSENADFITAFMNDETVFSGQIDEIVNIKNDSGVITRIAARSRAAALLDNEAEPVTYINPAPEFIFNRHLKPFGINDYEADSTPFFGALKIDKGMTHWQVFQNFCKNLYGSIPRITANGKAFFREIDNTDTVVFGKGDGKIDYYSAKESDMRYKLISEVRVKLDEFGTYSGRIENQNGACRNITRVRYVNATADTSTIETADKIISQSNSDSYKIVLEFAGSHINLIGKKAVIEDEVLGKNENLIVSKIKYTLTKSGEKTVAELRKEKF